MSLPTNFFIGRGGGAGPAILSISGSYNTYTENGISLFHTSNFSEYSSAARELTLDTTPGSVFYLGLVGSGGGGGRSSSGGLGGYGLSQVTVPPGVTQMLLLIGGRGDYSGSNPPGGQYGGGAGGTAGGSYPGAASGGGITGLFTGTNRSFSNLVVCVGSGGGGGVSALGGHGGGINQDGRGGGNGTTNHNSANTTDHGGGGRTTIAGVKATFTNSYSGNDQQDGSELTGGRGSGSQYDGGSGGGAGRYGGGGGKGGGGYDGGAGGGGSGYATSFATVTSTGTGETGPIGHGPATALTSFVRSNAGVSNFNAPGGYGVGGTSQGGGRAGYAVFWNAA